MRGERLRFARDILNIEQRDMAKDLGISQSKLSRAERSRSKNFPVDILPSLRKLYNINDQWILSGMGKPFLKGPHKDVFYDSKADEEKDLIHRLLNQYDKKERLILESLKETLPLVKNKKAHQKLSVLIKTLKKENF